MLLLLVLALAVCTTSAWQSDLGVVKLPPLYAKAPLDKDAKLQGEATVTLHIWARRVGGPDVKYAMPHQKKVIYLRRALHGCQFRYDRSANSAGTQTYLRAFIWVDYTVSACEAGAGGAA